MWTGSPRLTRFTEAAFRASTLAACVTATAGPATAQAGQRVAVAGQVLPRCWAEGTTDRRPGVVARCSSRSTQVEIAVDEVGDGLPRPCVSKTERADVVECRREHPTAPLRVTVTPRS